MSPEAISQIIEEHRPDRRQPYEVSTRNSGCIWELATYCKRLQDFVHQEAKERYTAALMPDTKESQ